MGCVRNSKGVQAGLRNELSPPHAALFHAYSVCGREREYIVVFGGVVRWVRSGTSEEGGVVVTSRGGLPEDGRDEGKG